MEFKSRDFTDAERVLRIRNLKVGLAGRPNAAPVLDGIDLDIRAGETHCLVGESGSGKSVTSLCAMGLLPRDALEIRGGSIDLEGFEITTATAGQMRELRARRIAMIFQEPMTALNPVLRVGDQIEEVLNMHTDLSKAEAKKRTLDMMDQVHLPDVERIYQAFPHQLSGGQRQRIMIAMALILDPDLLIADEPTTALDVTTQLQILKLIAEMQERQGTAVLFITHDMGVVAEIADTVSVMQQGRIVERAPIRRLLTEPGEDYTRKLLTAVPNLAPRAARGAATARDVITVDRLDMTYGGGGFLRKSPGVKAARDVSFTIAPGRTLGIVGESGSGKSTVARCIMRLIDPTAGRVTVARHRDRAAVAAPVAAAPQASSDRVPGPLPLAQPALDRGAQPVRGADQLRHFARRCDGPRRRTDGAGRSAARCARPVSAPVLGGPEAAHRHRPRRRDEARPSGRRRSRLGA